MSTYRIVATFVARPWWALGLFERTSEVVMEPQPDVRLGTAEELRRIALGTPGCTGVRIEVVE